MDSPFIREARLQEPANGQLRCLTCERRCLLDDGQAGWCRTRENRAGALYTLIYGAISSLSANPIEKKPFYHFYPGSRALTSGAWSCNFGCPWCQYRRTQATSMRLLDGATGVAQRPMNVDLDLFLFDVVWYGQMLLGGPSYEITHPV